MPDPPLPAIVPGEGEEGMNEKPPLGIMPHKLWIEERAVELAETIGRNARRLDNPQVRAWCEELAGLLEELAEKPIILPAGWPMVKLAGGGLKPGDEYYFGGR